MLYYLCKSDVTASSHLVCCSIYAKFIVVGMDLGRTLLRNGDLCRVVGQMFCSHILIQKVYLIARALLFIPDSYATITACQMKFLITLGVKDGSRNV